MVVVTLALSHGVAARARAAPPTSPESALTNEQRALRLFRRSEDLYRDGKFGEAASLLRDAYRLTSRPVLLYNLARAYEGQGDFESAASSYEAYLAAEPQARDRTAIEGRVLMLRSKLAEQETLRRQRELALEAQKAASLRAVSERHSAPTRLPWIMVGAGAAGAITGVILNFEAQSLYREARDDEPTGESVMSKVDDARRLTAISTVVMVAGGAVMVGGLTWALLDLRRKRPGNASAVARLELRPSALVLHGTF